jgi:two-component system, cell cycle sensor histidine kinase and response regulator CckA
MAKGSHKQAKKSDLRDRAEEKFTLLQTAKPLPKKQSDIQALLHELQVHQIELETQNAQLRLAESEAEAAQRKYADLYDLAPVGYFTLDEHGDIEEVNLTGAALLGLERGLLQRQRFALHVVEADRAAFNDFFRKTITDSAEQSCDLKLTKSDGTPFPAEIQGISVAADTTRPRQIYLAIMDVTRHARLEEQLRQAQKMEVVGRLAGGVAHEFNNLLTVIRIHAQLMLAREVSDPEVGVSARQITEATVRAADLTRQLLTFSRRRVKHARDLDLNETIGNMIKMLQRIVGEHIKLESCFAPDLPFVHADPGMMEQVFLNLAINSRDAMPHGGRLTISTAFVAIDESYVQRMPEASVGDFVCLTIEDTGSGITPPDLAHLFEPFFTTKDVGKGTGMGLATVYGIVKEHDGWIEVASTVGQGTVFHVYLPGIGRPTATVAPGAIDDSPIRGGSETILVVEDESAVRALVRIFLKRLGYTVLETDSGPAAYEIWQRHQDSIDLLFTDIMLPGGMTGIETAAKLRADNPKIRVIYTSGYSSATAGPDFFAKEGRHYIQKPYDPRKLARMVRQCLDDDAATL